MSETLHDYIKGRKVGEGTYGVVYEGFNQKNERVALKMIKTNKADEETWGIHFTALREIRILTELKSDYVVDLKDVFLEKRTMWLVYEFLDTDLKNVIESTTLIPGSLPSGDIKSYMMMMLKGLEYLHGNWVLHRDLAPGNLLISPEGILKIGDFSLGKKYGEDANATPDVVTIWYRAPELLLGATHYADSVDMWSAGCIFAEMMLRLPYFAGNTEISQIQQIFAALGTPTKDEWENIDKLPRYIKFKEWPRTPYRQIFSRSPAATDDALDLLDKLLKFDPNKRLSATEALQHVYFRSQPQMTSSDALLLPSRVKARAQMNQAISSDKRRKLESGKPVPTAQPEEKVLIKSDDPTIDVVDVDNNTVIIKDEDGGSIIKVEEMVEYIPQQQHHHQQQQQREGDLQNMELIEQIKQQYSTEGYQQLQHFDDQKMQIEQQQYQYQQYQQQQLADQYDMKDDEDEDDDELEEQNSNYVDMSNMDPNDPRVMQMMMQSMQTHNNLLDNTRKKQQ
eukprot:TRINITY_DN2375_c0_g1_i1.p1 TRINITY_DN2375_c0_g1~~TRINITY_DN2375_c0_g1_i1.p1  ORF type:complete len:509 (+),score=183.25 TRINITY_DN2375_c0_g1_i1:3-1529(+)